jgi:putative restriction endonuclease
MNDLLKTYLEKFKKLKIDRTHGIAPHKPILLLSILQMFQNGTYNSNKIDIKPELVAFFNTNWSLLVTTNHDCRISYPFYYLKSSDFWKLVPKDRTLNIGKLESSVKSFNKLNAAVEYALIPNELLYLMSDKISNVILQQCLLDVYFPLTKHNFKSSQQEQLKIFDEIENKILTESPDQYQQEVKKLIKEKNEEELFLRGSLFKREIPKIYNNTCCISGMKIEAFINISMIDACHIIPFSESYDDTITNGIALCPNLHRAFDRGLIGINESYRVIVSKVFTENSTNYGIRVFEGKEIKLPNLKSHYPKKENLEWHMKNVFRFET